MTRGGPIRVAMVAGTLGQGGAEKQLVAMAGALHARGVDVRVLSLGRGEFHEASLRAFGVEPEWVGARRSPLLRLAEMTRTLHPWRPHVVHATHCFANLYAAALGRLLGAVDVGSVRNDGVYDVAGLGAWGPWLLGAPRAMIANSHAGASALRARGRSPHSVHVFANVLDLQAFDAAAARPAPATPAREGRVVAITVSTLSPVKALERFVDALALARRTVPTLEGWMVGDGPTLPLLTARARAAGLEGALHFLGRRPDVPALLRCADVQVLTSRHEGTPNAVMEAMAAGLPVVATDVGDVARLVRDGETGYVVGAGPEDAIVRTAAEHMVRLATDRTHARRLGEAGRRVIEREYASANLADRLLRAYATMAERQGRGVIAARLEGYAR